MMAQHDRERESREALERVRRDSETIGSSSLARAGRRLGDHFGGRDAQPGDWAEAWGRRIGRALSVAAFVGLAWLLGAQLGLW